MGDFKVRRLSEFNGSTVSCLELDGASVGYGLEDGHNDPKIYGETRIPEGRYRLKLRTHGGFHGRYTKKFPSFHKGMIEICDVEGFTDVLFHIGNTKKDTHGCLLSGSNYVKRKDGYFVGSSGSAYKKIYPLIAQKLENGEEVYINIMDPC